MLAPSKTVIEAMSGSKTDTIFPNNPCTVKSKIQQYINIIYGETVLNLHMKKSQLLMFHQTFRFFLKLYNLI